MIKIENKRGITLIALIITITVVLILTSVTIYVGTDSIHYARVIKFVAYMQTIQKKVDLIVESNNYEGLGTNLTSAQLSKLSSILASENEEFETTAGSQTLKYFNSNNISSQLGIDNVEDEVIVDFATREVISLKGVDYEGETFYSQYYLPGGQKLFQNEAISRNVIFGTINANINGINATFTINNIGITNGTLSYSTDNLNWVVITNYTVQGENIVTDNISKSGTYYFKLADNTSSSQYISSGIQLVLTNAPKIKGDLELLTEVPYNYGGGSEEWAYAEDSVTGYKYVWIPRYAYQTAAPANIEFLRGTSEVTTSNRYITSDWTVPEKFNNGDLELTGVWVKVNNSYVSNLSLSIIESGIIL